MCYIQNIPFSEIFLMISSIAAFEGAQIRIFSGLRDVSSLIGGNTIFLKILISLSNQNKYVSL